MWRLAAAFFDIAVHRRGPDHLPASQFLFGLLFVSYLIVGFVAIRIGDTSTPRALPLFILDSLIYYAYIWLLLSLFRRQGRFLQTASALIGVDVFFNMLSLPLVAWSGAVESSDGDPSLPLLLFIVLFFWSIDVAGYIVSRALERPYIVGVLIVIMYVMVSMSIRESLAPVPA